MDFSRRMAQEKDLDKNVTEGLKFVNAGNSSMLPILNDLSTCVLLLVFDESGNFILYPTMLGIKG